MTDLLLKKHPNVLIKNNLKYQQYICADKYHGEISHSQNIISHAYISNNAQWEIYVSELAQS